MKCLDWTRPGTSFGEAAAPNQALQLTGRASDPSGEQARAARPARPGQGTGGGDKQPGSVAWQVRLVWEGRPCAGSARQSDTAPCRLSYPERGEGGTSG